MSTSVPFIPHVHGLSNKSSIRQAFVFHPTVRPTHNYPKDVAARESSSPRKKRDTRAAAAASIESEGSMKLIRRITRQSESIIILSAALQLLQVPVAAQTPATS